MHAVFSSSQNTMHVADATSEQIQDTGELTVVITGSDAFGFERAEALARKGARVIVAGHSAMDAAVSIKQVQERAPSANVEFDMLDLGSLLSIAAFGRRLRSSTTRLDILINNATVVMTPERRTTIDGFERQVGTNYLGHFALTAHLLPLLAASDCPRVVTVSSPAAASAASCIDDLQSTRSYNPVVAYSRSKLATLMFAAQLQRYSDEAGWGIRSTTAQSIGVGCQVPLEGGGPAPTLRSIQPYDTARSERLWIESERLTGVHFSDEAPRDRPCFEHLVPLFL